MSDTTPPEAAQPSGEDSSSSGASVAPAVGVPDFAEVGGNSANAAALPMDRFAGVQVVLTAELGRATLSLQELMQLTEGQIIELGRTITAPVELIAQGVPLGNGEVVVVDDQFAIRIRELYQTSQA